MPSVKNVQSKSILEISQELDRLKDLGSKNALSPADLAPGTITLSNIGSIGGTLMHPVLVQGQVCIGAIGKVQTLPRYIPGSTIPVPTQVLSVSFNADHRVVDGATMARFVQEWKRYIETPLMMNLHLR